MRRKIEACAAVALPVGFLGVAALRSDGGTAHVANADERRKAIDTFNAKFLAAHLKMDT
jgi:hypothetical protein